MTSIAILEAMAAGKPVVATRVGEYSTKIDNEVEGLLVEPKDVDGMVAALGRLIDDGELRRRQGTAAARKIAERFTVAQIIREGAEEVYATP